MNTKKFFRMLFLMLIFLGTILTQSHSSAKNESETWMSKLADDKKICNLNIPGTHDSGTARTTVFTCTAASCQNDSIPEQLKKGIRYLDIRIDANLLVNHGGVSCYKSTFYRLYLWDVLDYVRDFLKNNPGETVIIQLKEEGSSQVNFSQKVSDELARYNMVYSGSGIPSELTLGELRGKTLIVAIIAFLEITIWFLVARTALNTELNILVKNLGVLPGVQRVFQTLNHKENIYGKGYIWRRWCQSRKEPEGCNGAN